MVNALVVLKNVEPFRQLIRMVLLFNINKVRLHHHLCTELRIHIADSVASEVAL